MRIYIVITILISLNSCSLYYGCDSDNDLVTLPESTRSWTPYFQGQELIFENDLSESVIKVFKYTDITEPYFRGDECAPGTQEVVISRLISNSFTDTIKIRLHQGQAVDFENTQFQMTYRESDKALYPQSDPNSRHESTLTINGKTFSDVLIAKCQLCDNLSEIVFEKETGLVAYKLDNLYWTKK